MAQARPNKNSKERWLVTNTTRRELAISDVLSIPAIRAGRTIDLLQYATREQISYSNVLTVFIKRGWLTSRKIHKASGEQEAIDGSTVDKAFIPRQNADNYDPIGEGSSAENIADLGDVDITGLSDDQVLQYDTASGKWLPVDLSVLGGYGTSDFNNDFATKTIDDLDGISISGDDTPDDGDVLTYSGGSVDAWVPAPKSRIPITISYNLDATIDFIIFDTGGVMNFGYNLEGNLLTITEGSIVKTLQYNVDGLISGIVVS